MTVSCVITLVTLYLIKSAQDKPLIIKPISKNVLPASDQKISQFPSPKISSPSPTLILSPTPKTLKKKNYAIALFGDSMIDTMGEKLETLQKTLKENYPITNFTLYNYGIGGQNVSQGLARFDSPFTNRERQYPPISTIGADIIIVGSFAYNPFPTHDKNKHFEELSSLVRRAKNVAPQVYILAEIAPLKSGFGAGKNGINWPENLAYEHALRIIEQLDNAVAISKSENVYLINAYYESRIDGTFGDPLLVNQDDGIHPSYSGHVFMSKIIASAIFP